MSTSQASPAHPQMDIESPAHIMNTQVYTNNHLTHSPASRGTINEGYVRHQAERNKRLLIGRAIFSGFFILMLFLLSALKNDRL